MKVVFRKKIRFQSNNRSIQVLYKTYDGIVWETVASALPKETILSTFNVGNSIFLITNSNKYISSDGGITWNPDKLWDTDGDVFPDDIYSITASDSVAIVAYQERPSNTKRLVMYKNSVWKNIPIELYNLSFDPYYYLFSMSVLDNKCIVVERSLAYPSNETVRSFKLY